MQGYITKKGMVFTTKLRVVEKSVELSPRIVAEPGDMLCVEGDLLYNLSRAAYNDPRVVYNLDKTKFVEEKVS